MPTKVKRDSIVAAQRRKRPGYVPRSPKQAKAAKEKVDVTKDTEALTAKRRQGRRKKIDCTDYEVGYGKPPKQHQFAPGQTGNPRGRPKKAKPKSVRDVDAIADAFYGAAERINTVTIGGKTQELTMLQTMMMQLANKAASGDLRAIRMVIELARGLSGNTDSNVEELPPEVQAVLEQMLADYGDPNDHAVSGDANAPEQGK